MPIIIKEAQITCTSAAAKLKLTIIVGLVGSLSFYSPGVSGEQASTAHLY
jgi:hypothetical protein